MGPAAVRYTGLISRLRNLGHDVVDTGDISIPIRDCEVANGKCKAEDKYLKEITQICESIYKVGKDAVKKNHFPLFIGGDHSIDFNSLSDGLSILRYIFQISGMALAIRIVTLKR